MSVAQPKVGLKTGYGTTPYPQEEWREVLPIGMVAQELHTVETSNRRLAEATTDRDPTTSHSGSVLGDFAAPDIERAESGNAATGAAGAVLLDRGVDQSE
ncbi:MAG: hypothetical protein R6W83_11940 [Cryobacterium sp.]